MHHKSPLMMVRSPWSKISHRLVAACQKVRYFRWMFEFRTSMTITGGYERLLDVVAPNALHDAGHVVDPPKCHPGTRISIIQTIIEWIAGSNEANRDKLFTWLTGAAGSGKSAIGRSVCERCSEEGTLLASFFSAQEIQHGITQDHLSLH